MKKISSILFAALLVFLPPVGQIVDAQNVYGTFTGNSPVWQSVGTLTVFADREITTRVEARDPNGDALTYWAVQLPANATFNPTTQIVTFTPTLFQVGTAQIVLAVTDYKTPPVENRIFINVVDNNARNRTDGYVQVGARPVNNFPPVFTSSATSYSVLSGNELQFTVAATDAEGDFLTFTATDLPVGSHFDTTTRIFSWTPQINQVGTHRLLFQVGDGYGHGAQMEVSITVSNPVLQTGFFSETSYAPQFVSSPSTVAVAGAVYKYQARAYDLENEAVVYRIVSGPTGAVIDERTGLLRWFPSSDQYGQNHSFVIGVTDGKSVERVQTFTVSVSGQRILTQTEQPQVVYTQTTVQEPSVVRVPSYAITAASTYVPLQTTIPLSAFGITVRSTENNEVVVSWLTNQDATGEVVFGTTSHLENSSQIWNYDFTSGEHDATTRHEVTLGSLIQQQTYYLRVISRAGSRIDVTRELAFVPFTVSQSPIIISQNQDTSTGSGAFGTASVLDIFATGEYILLGFLVLIIFLLVYLIFRPARRFQI